MATARIQTQYDFTANTSNAEAAVKRYSDQIKAANAVLAQAEKTAKETYSSQTLVAKAAGASTEQLTKIQQGYFQSLVAIRNAAKDTGTQLVQSNQQSVVSEDAKAEAVKFATAAIEQQTIAVKANAAAHSQGHVVSGQSAASGAVQLLEGRNGIRSVENFLGTTLGLGGALGAIFPLVGAVQFSKLIADEIEGLVKMRREALETGDRIHEAFESLNGAAQTANDQLHKSNAELANSIAKLEHKPVNASALAFADLALAADHATERINRAYDAIKKTLEQNQNGAFSQIFLGKGDTGVVSDNVRKQLEELRDLARKYRDQIHSGASQDALSQTQSDITAHRNSLLTYANNEIKTRTGSEMTADVDARTGMVSNQRWVPYAQLHGSQQENLNTLYGIKDYVYNEQDFDSSSATNASLQTRKAQDESRKQTATDAAKSQRERWDQEHNEFELGAERSKADEVGFWQAKLATVRNGTENYRVALDKYVAAWRQMVEETNKLSKENTKLDAANSKIYSEMDADVSRQFWSEQNQQLSVGARLTNEFVRSLSGLAEATSRANQTQAESAIAHDLAEGKITKHDAAVQLQTLHTQQYAESLEQLKSALANVTGDDLESNTRRNSLRKQIVDLQSNRSQQSYNDNAEVAGTTVAGALKNANQQWLSQTQNLAPQIASVYTNVFQGMNQEITNLLLGQKTSWASFFESIAAQFAKIGLNSLEAPLMSGTTGNSRSGSTFGTLLKSIPVIGGLFGGFRADGGGVDAGKTYLVGERGPELFNPGTSGSITPNHKLNNLGSSQSHFYDIHVPNGVTPEQFHQTMSQLIPQIRRQAAGDAVKAMSERDRRKPATASR